MVKSIRAVEEARINRALNNLDFPLKIKILEYIAGKSPAPQSEYLVNITAGVLTFALLHHKLPSGLDPAGWDLGGENENEA